MLRNIVFQFLKVIAMLFEKLISLWTQGSRVQPLLIAELTSELSSKPHRATFIFWSNLGPIRPNGCSAGLPAALHLRPQVWHRLCRQVHRRWRCHRRCRWIWSWNWLRFWVPHHWLCQVENLENSWRHLIDAFAGTPPWSSSCSPTPSWDSPSPRPWVFSASWWPSFSCSLSKQLIFNGLH